MVKKSCVGQLLLQRYTVQCTKYLKSVGNRRAIKLLQKHVDDAERHKSDNKAFDTVTDVCALYIGYVLCVHMGLLIKYNFRKLLKS